MSNYSSTGEVYGSKALTFAIIAASAAILMGVVYSPAQTAAQPRVNQPAIEQVVVTSPATTPISG